MSPRPSKRGFIARNKLALWYCGLAVLGYLHFLIKVVRHPELAPGGVDWIWLGGSVALSLVGAALIAQERRTRSS